MTERTVSRGLNAPLMPGAAESFARGAGNGATLGWGDEGAAGLLGWLPKPADPEGLDRTYAAGSPTADYRNALRQDLALAHEANPTAYGAGELVGASPGAMATGGVGSGVAGAVGRGAVAGGITGAGNALEGVRVAGSAKGAAMGGALAGTLAAGARPAASALLWARGKLPPPPPSFNVPPTAHAVQEELPLPPPEYAYHSTPKSNLPGVAQRGLSPSEGGKNFDLAKNRGMVYFSPEEAIAQWKRTIGDVSGEGTALLRTTKPTAPVPGANAAVRVRTNTVPPERLEMLHEPTGTWGPLPSARDAVAPGRPTLPPEMPTIPRPGRVPSAIDEGEMARRVAKGDALDDAERAAREARFAPGKEAVPDPQLERLKYEADRLTRNAKTVPPKRRTPKPVSDSANP